MIYSRYLAAVLAVCFFTLAATAQRAEVTLSLNEGFFDSLLDTVFQNFDPPQFPLRDGEQTPGCDETITILREKDRVRTAVRFRGGAIAIPLAFSGRYSLPLVGCVDFTGTADANAALHFDPENQRIIARAGVDRVSLSGTKGVGGSLVASLVRGSIEKKINPIEVIKLDKLSFAFPVRDAGNIKLKAVSARTEPAWGVLHIHVTYEFLKG